LAASVIAAFRGEKDISLGNLIGSNLFNILAVLGLTSLVKPIDVAEQIMAVDIWWLLATSFAILPIGIARMRIGRKGGMLLFAAYATYIYIVFVGTGEIEGVLRSIIGIFS
jgi:cation:H+ antiporter